MGLAHLAPAPVVPELVEVAALERLVQWTPPLAIEERPEPDVFASAPTLGEGEAKRGEPTSEPLAEPAPKVAAPKPEAKARKTPKKKRASKPELTPSIVAEAPPANAVPSEDATANVAAASSAPKEPAEAKASTGASADASTSGDEEGSAVASAGGSASGSPTGTSLTGAAPRSAPNLGALKKGYMRALYPSVKRSYFYPKMAKRLGLEGRVLVSLEIDARGKVVRVSLHEPSDHALLNEAALEAMGRIQKVPAPPAELMADRRTLRVTVPLKYALRGRG